MRSLCALAIACATSGLMLVDCGGGQTRGSPFDASWADDHGAGVAGFQRRFASTPIPLGASAAIGVVATDVIVGVPLTGGQRWRFQHALDCRPHLAGTVVVGMGDSELFALDALTGALLWKRAAGGQLRGAGDDGQTTIVSLLESTGTGTTILAVTHAGSIVRQIPDEADIGVPAVVDGFAFLPWAGKYVTVYDLVNGEEAARALFPAPTSRAFTSGGALFFGESGAATRLDDRIRGCSIGNASTARLPSREIPGSPKWMLPGADVTPLPSTKADAIRLYARPSAKGAAGIAGGRYVATYSPIALGLDAESGALRWVHTHDADFLGGAAYDGGFALCDRRGTVSFFDGATGASAGVVSLGAEVESCEVQAEALEKVAGARDRPLVAEIERAILLPRADLEPLRSFLMSELAHEDDAGATRVLIDLASSDAAPPEVAGQARTFLAARRSGAPAMLAALASHYDYLAGRLRPPPVGALADALAAMGEHRAAPLLAAQLNDPANSIEDVRRAAAALSVLAAKEQTEELAAFFAHYRATAEEDALVDAVAWTARALVKCGARAIVARAAADPLTKAEVRARLQAELAPAGGAP
jgi:outer membrane protein assembly factor BamB